VLAHQSPAFWVQAGARTLSTLYYSTFLLSTDIRLSYRVDRACADAGPYRPFHYCLVITTRIFLSGGQRPSASHRRGQEETQYTNEILMYSRSRQSLALESGGHLHMLSCVRIAPFAGVE
jgi:hypothetical protein